MAKLSLPSGSQFNYDKAIELANLIERSYENYKNFKDPDTTNQLLSSGVITTGSQKIKDLCNDPDSATVEPIKGDIEYKVLGVFREFVGQNNDTPMGFIAQRKNGESLTDDYYVIFRGTMEKDEWKENFRSEQDIFSIPDQGFENLGKVATGFIEVYTKKDPDSNSGLLSIADLIAKIFKQNQLPATAKIFVSGHSLGGALATMATRHLLAMNLKPILYSYASPRVGDQNFAEALSKTQYYRVANSEDIVPYVAFATLNPTGDDVQSNNFVKGRIDGLLKFTRLFDLDIINSKDQYVHAGEPIYFTDNRGAISMNHNMYRTYREALKDR